MDSSDSESHLFTTVGFTPIHSDSDGGSLYHSDDHYPTEDGFEERRNHHPTTEDNYQRQTPWRPCRPPTPRWTPNMYTMEEGSSLEVSNNDCNMSGAGYTGDKEYGEG